MAGTSAGGWPYVTPDDHPKDFPTHSQALANKLDGLPASVASGTVTTAGVGVTFPVGRFTVAPHVVGTAENGGPAIVTVAGVSTAGFTIRCFNTAGAALSSVLYWQAVQYT
jgi:hypothetical protein